MTTMSTPTRTPHRPYVPAIDTSAGHRQVKDEYCSYSGWETPLSAPERRRPSLTHSILSEPSAMSVPSTPGFGPGNSYSTIYVPNALAANARAMEYEKPDANIARSMQGLTYDMSVVDDKYHAPVVHANERYQAGMLVSPVEGTANQSFTTVASWGNLPHSQPPFVFRPRELQRVDSFSSIDPMAGSYAETLASEASGLTTATTPNSSFHTSSSQSFLTPQQLIIPSANVDHEGYVYVNGAESGLTTPIEQAPLYSTSFDSSLASMSPWSHVEASPINEYGLPGTELVTTSAAIPQEDEMDMGFTMVPLPDWEQSLATPRRSRLRGRTSSRRGRAITHQIAHHSYGVDVAIDSKSLKVDIHGRITKKTDAGETKKFKCHHEGCESRSARKEHLRRHELSHLPERQFHCNLPKCNRAITRSDNLIQHLMTHVRPPKAGKRNNHHSPQRVERMVLDTMTDRKLAERTITNLRKAIEREQDKWQWPQGMDRTEEMEWQADSEPALSNDEAVEKLKYEN